MHFDELVADTPRKRQRKDKTSTEMLNDNDDNLFPIENVSLQMPLGLNETISFDGEFLNGIPLIFPENQILLRNQILPGDVSQQPEFREIRPKQQLSREIQTGVSELIMNTSEKMIKAIVFLKTTTPPKEYESYVTKLITLLSQSIDVPTQSIDVPTQSKDTLTQSKDASKETKEFESGFLIHEWRTSSRKYSTMPESYSSHYYKLKSYIPKEIYDEKGTFTIYLFACNGMRFTSNPVEYHLLSVRPCKKDPKLLSVSFKTKWMVNSFKCERTAFFFEIWFSSSMNRPIGICKSTEFLIFARKDENRPLQHACMAVQPIRKMKATRNTRSDSSDDDDDDYNDEVETSVGKLATQYELEHEVVLEREVVFEHEVVLEHEVALDSNELSRVQDKSMMPPKLTALSRIAPLVRSKISPPKSKKVPIAMKKPKKTPKSTKIPKKTSKTPKNTTTMENVVKQVIQQNHQPPQTRQPLEILPPSPISTEFNVFSSFDSEWCRLRTLQEMSMYQDDKKRKQIDLGSPEFDNFVELCDLL